MVLECLLLSEMNNNAEFSVEKEADVEEGIEEKWWKYPGRGKEQKVILNTTVE